MIFVFFVVRYLSDVFNWRFPDGHEEEYRAKFEPTTHATIKLFNFNQLFSELSKIGGMFDSDMNQKNIAGR